MECVYQCPGLAIFGYDLKKEKLFLPVEYEVKEGEVVWLVNNNGERLGEGVVEKILHKPNKTHVARVKSQTIQAGELTKVRGFIVKDKYPEPLEFKPLLKEDPGATYICHCDDVKLEEVLKVVGDRTFISIDEIKHTTHLGMGPCRGKRCIPRLKTALREPGNRSDRRCHPACAFVESADVGRIAPGTKR